MKDFNLSETPNLVSEIELIYKSKIDSCLRPEITSAKDSYQLILRSWDKDKIELVEQFKVIYLNRGNRVLAIYELSTGGITGTVADPRLIFVAAVKLNATAIIIIHNHPSGNLRASHADESITNKIKMAGSFLDIKLMDHLIISLQGFFSFAEEGLL